MLSGRVVVSNSIFSDVFKYVLLKPVKCTVIWMFMAAYLNILAIYEIMDMISAPYFTGE